MSVASNHQIRMFSLINLLLIGYFASACFCVDLNASSSNDPQTTIVSSIARWIELHNSICNVSGRKLVTLAQFKMIIAEMSSIEQTEAFKIGLVDELVDPNSIDYHQILAKFYDANLIVHKDSTISKLLSRILDANLNNCTEEYFELLDELRESFKQCPISEALRENREIQYRDCWRRLVKSVVASAMLLGDTIKRPLNELTLLVYPNACEIVIPPIDANSPTHQLESSRIAETVARFLIERANKRANRDYFREFQVSIRHPCKLLVEKTKHLMTDIYGILSLDESKRNFMTREDVTLLNRFIMCDRIVAESTFISLHVAKCMKTLENPDQTTSSTAELNLARDDEGLDLITHYLTLETVEMPSEVANSPTQSAKLAAPSLDVYNECAALITQDIMFEACPIDTGPITTIESPASDGTRVELNIPTETNLTEQHVSINSSSAQESKDKARKSSESSGMSEPASKRRKMASRKSPTKANQVEVSREEPGSNTRYIVKILDGKGRGRNALYPTIWSDGSTTYEKKQYLITKCDFLWNFHHNERRSNIQRKYYERKSAEGAHPSELGSQLIAHNRTVVGVGRAVGRGLACRYPTLWSDGAKTDETKDYLEINWNDAWSRMYREVKAERQRRWKQKQQYKQSHTKKHDPENPI